MANHSLLISSDNSDLTTPITNPAAVVDCGTPPAAPVNGNQPVYSSTIFGSIVIYTYQAGYRREGNRTITCLANGQWSASAVVCNRELLLVVGSTSTVL